jgi:hypothetical protein
LHRARLVLARALLRSASLAWFVSLVTLAALAACASNASAYCRTTTVPVPPGYDPAVSGCWTHGRPIAWLWNEQVRYELASQASRQVGLADATRLADLAFAAWADAGCDLAHPGAHPNVSGFDDGPVAPSDVAAHCSTVPCDPTTPDPYHLIMFRDDAWAYDDPTNTLALTTVTYADDSGVLFDAEIEINSHDHALSVDEPPARGTFDLRAILTHEAGHFLGLAHATDVSSVMYAYYSPGSIDLTADDVAGICDIYPPLDPPGGCSVTRRGTEPSAVPSVLVALAGLGALVRLSRRRRRRVTRR